MTLTTEDYYRLGRRQQLTPEGNEKAKEYFLKALDLDKDHLPAITGLSYVFTREYQNAWGADRTKSLDEAERYAKRAVELGDDVNSDWHNDFRGRWHLAIVYWNRGSFEDSFTEYQAARKLITDFVTDPEKAARYAADLDADMAEAYIYRGEENDPAEAIRLITGAMKSNPNFPYWYWWNLGRAYYMAKQYQDAIDAIGRITANDVRLITAASLAQLGDLDAARYTMAEFRKYDPNWSLAKSAEYQYGSADARQRWIDGLRKAGLT